jgi:ABC-type multidrug transport system fused ATPase/permease subunit
LASTAWAACTLSVLGPYAALAAHDHHRGVLDPERIFTIVATINLMSPPLILLGSFSHSPSVSSSSNLRIPGSSMPQLQAAYASLKRIQKYLSLEERDDVLLRNDESEHRIPSTEKGREASEDITIEGASFSWAADKPAFLGPLSLVLTPAHLHLCTGPVASVGHPMTSVTQSAANGYLYSRGKQYSCCLYSVRLYARPDILCLQEPLSHMPHKTHSSFRVPSETTSFSGKYLWSSGTTMF